MKLKLLITIFLFSQISCKKNPFDYRSKFIGCYNFTINQTEWTLLGTTLDTTFSYSGNVQIGNLDDKILIKFADRNSIEALVYEDGTISNSYDVHQSLRGEFETMNKLNFKIINSGLGGGSGFTIYGEKK